jgi:hypothetical protein
MKIENFTPAARGFKNELVHFRVKIFILPLPLRF